jgi:hypothetical protein
MPHPFAYKIVAWLGHKSSCLPLCSSEVQQMLWCCALLHSRPSWSAQLYPQLSAQFFVHKFEHIITCYFLHEKQTGFSFRPWVFHSVIEAGCVSLQEMMPDPDSPQPVLEFHRSWVEPSDYFPTSETGLVLPLLEHCCLHILVFHIKGGHKFEIVQTILCDFLRIYSNKSQLY